MKQIVILSGKGGTGKTSLAAGFAHLAHTDTHALHMVLADADVDAANLELVLNPAIQEQHDFIGGAKAVIDPARCEGCGRCAEVCRFDAILQPIDANSAYRVDPIACDGCAACVHQCPAEAIQMRSGVAGQWYRSDTRYGPLVHAALKPAQENSGKLVTLVKQQARLIALREGGDAVLVDGPPGIGCAVISAVAGADLALIVAEPTAAGIHDMQRALQTTAHFKVPSMVCVNKADISPAGAEQIESHCAGNGIELAGRIPFDPTVTEAMIQAQPVTAYCAEAPASRAIATIWRRVADRLRSGAEQLP